jgi:hypothetical protein
VKWAAIAVILVALVGCSSGGSGGLKPAADTPITEVTTTTESAFIDGLRAELRIEMYTQALVDHPGDTPPDDLTCYTHAVVDNLPADLIRQWDEQRTIPWGDSRTHETLFDLERTAARRCHLS